MSPLNNFSFKNRMIWTVTLLLLLVAFFFSFRRPNEVALNTYLGQVNLGAKEKDDVFALISAKLSEVEKSKFVLLADGEKTELSLVDGGISFDSEATVLKAFRVGRSGNSFRDLIFTLRSPFVKTALVPVYNVDFPKLVSNLDLILRKYEVGASDSMIVFRGGVPEISQHQVGRAADRGALIKLIYARIDHLAFEPMQISFVEDQPRIKSAQAQSALERVKNLDNQRIILSFGQDTWKLEDNNLLSILEFYPSDQEGGQSQILRIGPWPMVFKWLKYSNSAAVQLEVSMNDKKLDEFIGGIAKTLDRETVDATIRFEGGKAVEFTPAMDGRSLDEELVKKLIIEKISIENVSGEKDIRIALPVMVKVAKIASEEINSLGIKELIGKGVSYFSGSIANRIHNVRLGAGRINGTLVKPGDVFSFNKTIGDVSGATGYKQAYVIAQGRTVLDDGGGICQVSTTLFRAVLNAGLPIAARTAHAYRVAYYERGGFKPGLDATVWAPAVDFQFKNDTIHHILVQTTIDYNLAKLEIDIYGTFDGRKVELSTPVITNQTPALADKYQDDPSLPRGTKKQVDFAAPGATTVFTRKVWRGDVLLIDESFKSVYRPWQAVYLVGTGT